MRDPLLVRDLRTLAAAGQRAHERMVLANMRLVHFWVRRRVVVRQHGALSVDDLVSEGTLGLLHAVQMFDFTLGYKFSTYASNWIRSRMQRAVARSTPATVDARTSQQLAALCAVEDDLHLELGRNPTAAELGQRLGAPERHVRALRSVQRVAISFDAPLGHDDPGGGVLGDVLADPEADCFASTAADDLSEQVRRLLRHLGARQRQVLVLRFGLGGAAHTVPEAARVLRVTEAMVRDVLQAALARLRRNSATADLYVFLEAA